MVQQQSCSQKGGKIRWSRMRAQLYLSLARYLCQRRPFESELEMAAYMSNSIDPDFCLVSKVHFTVDSLIERSAQEYVCTKFDHLVIDLGEGSSIQLWCVLSIDHCESVLSFHVP